MKLRPPLQARTQESWNRVLVAGVKVLEEDGYEGFTIAAICKRANVSPPAIYARVRDKNALFVAVFEHGFSPIREEQSRALDPVTWARDTPEQTIRSAVETIARTTLTHEHFLRPIILRAEEDDDIAEQTREARAGVAGRFRELALRHAEALREPTAACVDACFRIVFAALLTRITHVNALDIGVPFSDEELISDLQEFAVRALLK